MRNYKSRGGIDMKDTLTYSPAETAHPLRPLPPVEPGTATIPISRSEKPKLVLLHTGGRYRISTTSYGEFGRDHFVDMGLVALFISKRHFALKYEDGKLYITDLGSKNGTYVNGVDIRGKEWVELRPGDVVKIANVEFRVVENP